MGVDEIESRFSGMTPGFKAVKMVIFRWKIVFFLLPFLRKAYIVGTS